MIDKSRGKTSGVMTRPTIRRRGDMINRQTDGPRRIIGAIMTGDAIAGNARMCEILCWRKRCRGMAHATILVRWQVVCCSLAGRGQHEAVMTTFAAT